MRLMTCERAMLNKKLSVMHIMTSFRVFAKKPIIISVSAEMALEVRIGVICFCSRSDIDDSPELLLAAAKSVAYTSSCAVMGILVMLWIVSEPIAISIAPYAAVSDRIIGKAALLVDFFDIRKDPAIVPAWRIGMNKV